MMRGCTYAKGRSLKHMSVNGEYRPLFCCRIGRETTLLLLSSRVNPVPTEVDVTNDSAAKEAVTYSTNGVRVYIQE